MARSCFATWVRWPAPAAYRHTDVRWGVAKDDKKAFAELRQACEESLAEGGIDFHQSPGAVKLTASQKKTLTVGTSPLDQVTIALTSSGICPWACLRLRIVS